MLSFLLFAGPFSLVLRPQDALSSPATALGPIQSLLVLDPTPSGARGRGPVYTDPIELELVRGTFRSPLPPGTGEAVESAADPAGPARAWREIRSPEGRYEDPALAGGWAWARIESPEERVLMLEASGHSHVYVDGEPRAGDIYELGTISLPILVRKSGAELLFKGGRGRLRASLSEPLAAQFVDGRDLTLPDIVRGVMQDSYAGITLVNATNEPQGEFAVRLEAELAGSKADLGSLRVPRLQPLETRKVSLPLPLKFEVDAGLSEIDLIVTLNQVLLDQGSKQELRHQAYARLHVRKPGEPHRVAFVSEIDGSTQVYAVTPARPAKRTPARPGLVLSLHGANVDAQAQAASYAPKPWCHIVAPQGRGLYGFDWEDWGRLDALEVLRDAALRLSPDLARCSLTGHSMGGHGAWQLGTHCPGLFAAVAPSAGWSDFWSYGGAWEADPASPVEVMLARAANDSRTALLLENLAPRGVYVLHGEKDDNVPAEQSRALVAKLAPFHRDLAHHEEPGAGHWWGSACVDWPPLFQFLSERRLPYDADVHELHLATVNPAVTSRLNWVVIEAQQRSLLPSRVDVLLDPAKRLIQVRTRNVARLLLEAGKLAQARPGEPPPLPGGEPFRLLIDNQPALEITWPVGAPANAQLRLVRSRSDGTWEPTTDVPAALKGPHRAGPFKAAFDRNMLFVYGTQGTPEENAWAFSKARYDAETWRYRANGLVEYLADVAFDSARFPDRNLIVYGHADMVAGFDKLVQTGEFEVRRGRLRVGARKLERDDLAFLAVYPRLGEDHSSVGLVAGTGPVGLRLTNQLPYFRSGVAYPDWTVIAPEMLALGGAGVLGAGFFGELWSVADGDSAWRSDLRSGD